MLFVFCIYTTVGFVGIYRYGVVKSSILDDIAETKVHLWENYVMQVLFMIILSCHIPFCFFFGKESLLLLIDEIMRKSISYTLSKKILQD